MTLDESDFPLFCDTRHLCLFQPGSHIPCLTLASLPARTAGTTLYYSTMMLAVT